MQVRSLSEEVQDESSDVGVVDRGRLKSRVRSRTVDPVCQINTCDDPVIGTVYEYVADWHRARGELVDEEGLVFALDEV